MVEALFIPHGDAFIPTEHTRGGWSDDAQHGSPPSGLMAFMVERVPTAAPMQVVRFTVDLFRPVPLVPLTVHTILRRDGRRIQAVDALLSAEGVEVGRATALKIRTVDGLDLPHDDMEDGWDLPPGPEGLELADWAGVFDIDPSLTRFHTHAIEIRTVDGSFSRLGRGRSWFRLRMPVIAGVETSAFVRLATIADLSNGNSMRLPAHRFLYVNPDITLYAHREPVGEWIGMDSIAHQHDNGIGLADSLVFDRLGPLGRVNQAQLLDRRSPGPSG